MLKIILIQIVVTSFALSQGFVINESMSKNINTIFDEDGSSPDWIEIYNSNLNSQDIGGFFLSDNKNELNKWEFPEGILEPQSHLLVFTSDKDKNIWPQGEWVPLINLGATWNYKEGSATIPPNWNNISFDDSGWNAGASSIGYGDNDDMTTIDPVVSLYMRKIFTIADTSAISHGLLHMDYDDGFVAYINGNEIARKNLGVNGSNIPFNQFADTNVEAKIYLGLRPEKFIIENIKEYLNQGVNIISLQVHNASDNLIDLTALPVLSFFYTNPHEPSETTNITIRLKTDNY
ncbi:MAG: lamin tail domain-containing protein, partial [Candidatus Marinimicrobia bacterium]|nr:lamin tail domain-containing protein [Candidatus Neomarinimicrobiota bacterium]